MTDTPTPQDAFAFLRQLESNARTIASAKRGSARSEWTEDADEFARAIAAAAKLSRDLSECRAALELLRQYASDSDDHQYGTLSTSLVRGIVDEALGLPDAARAILPPVDQPGDAP